MKTIDFTQPGGFPLTQDQLGYLQTAYMECLGALGSGIGTGAAVRLSGMDSTHVGFTNYIGDGWLFYNGELIRFEAFGYGALFLGKEMYVVLSSTSSNVVYNDGSTKGVINERVATMQFLTTGSPENADQFRYANLLNYGQAIGLSYREQTWQHIVISPIVGQGSISGDIYYKKDIIANTLQLRGALAAFSPADFGAWPIQSTVLTGTLGAAYRPANRIFFTAFVSIGHDAYLDANGTYFTHLNATIDTTGDIKIGWVRPDASVTGYDVNFNCVLPLD